jgi:hypothetical protein
VSCAAFGLDMWAGNETSGTSYDSIATEAPSCDLAMNHLGLTVFQPGLHNRKRDVALGDSFAPGREHCWKHRHYGVVS